MIDTLGLSIVVPILANYIRKLQGDPPACFTGNSTINATTVPVGGNTTKLISAACKEALAAINSNTGLVSTAYAICSLISSFWMPLFSDRCGRRLASESLNHPLPHRASSCGAPGATAGRTGLG